MTKDYLASDTTTAPIRAMLALEAGRMGSWSWDIRTGLVTGDGLFANLFHLDEAAQPWQIDAVFASIHPDDLPKVQIAIATALESGDAFEVEFRDRTPDPAIGIDGVRWLGARGCVTARAPDGEPLTVIGVDWDVTKQKLQAQRLGLLASEMDHRVKNAFAVIRALINIGRSSENTKDGFAETLRAQVDAMATAHALSARMARESEDPRASVSAEDILSSALSPWLAGIENSLNRVALDCTENFHLTPQKVSALSMMIYELATNATKHGALGVAGGLLTVKTRRLGDTTYVIDWMEQTTARLDHPDSHAAGFGTVLIDHCVRTLSAKMTREVSQNGLHINLVLESKPA